MSSSIAQTALSQFNNAEKTISLVTVCKRLNGRIQNDLLTRRYLFPDGSILSVTGRGKNHRVEIASLPTL